MCVWVSVCERETLQYSNLTEIFDFVILPWWDFGNVFIVKNWNGRFHENCARSQWGTGEDDMYRTKDLGLAKLLPYPRTRKIRDAIVCRRTNCYQVPRIMVFENLIISPWESPSICFWRHSWFVPESSKLDSAHLLYLQGFVVQFPRNTRSSEVVSNLNFTVPLKTQDFSAFNPLLFLSSFFTL